MTRAQDTLVTSYIHAWRISDTSQCHRAQVLYDQLATENDTVRFGIIVRKLYAYLKEHPDTRLNARTILYESLGAKQFGYDLAPYIQRVEEALKMAHELEDEQLMAEIYSLLATMYDDSNYLLYNLKAIELQQKVGFSHFPYVHNRFFDASRGLYLSHDYRQCIRYGIKCLEFRGKDMEHWDLKVIIFQLDILGAAYKKLQQYDSTAYYYQQLLEALPETDMTPPRRKLWEGIAWGNLGHVLALQRQFSEAMPLLHTYVQISTDAGDWFNMALAQNALAEAYMLQEDKKMALEMWRKAYKSSIRSSSPDNAVRATSGMAGIYRETGPADSAFYYYDLHHAYKDSVAEQLSYRRLSAMQARLDFDELQYSLKKTQARLVEMHTTRNRILLAVGIIAILGLWMYNWYRLKQKYALQLLKRKQQQAIFEMNKAREQMASIATNIVQKNKLIDTLKKRITDQVKEIDQEDLTRCLGEYALFTDDDWERFKADFAQAYPDFLRVLRRQARQVTPAEERLSILLFLKLNTEQIANTLGISKDSVLRGKRRLKHRLNLPTHTTVEEYLYNILI